MRMSDGSSDVCSSDLSALPRPAEQPVTGLSDGRRKMGWAARKRDDWPMRRSHLTARPGRARFCAGSLGLLLVSAATALPAAAQIVPPDPASNAPIDKPPTEPIPSSCRIALTAAYPQHSRALRPPV